MAVSWRDLLLAWLHDPPDKALDIPGHVPPVELRGRRGGIKRPEAVGNKSSKAR